MGSLLFLTERSNDHVDLIVYFLLSFKSRISVSALSCLSNYPETNSYHFSISSSLFRRKMIDDKTDGVGINGGIDKKVEKSGEEC